MPMSWVSLAAAGLCITFTSIILYAQNRKKRHKEEDEEGKGSRACVDPEKAAQFAARRDAIVALPLVDPSKNSPPPEEAPFFKTESRYDPSARV
jgi:hypothetical protein